jgi:GDP-L-fucose synthase
VIPALIRKCAEAQQNGKPEIVLWGDGTPTREFLYVEDAAEGILLAAEQYNDSRPLNLGTGEELSIKALAGIIAAEVGFQGRILWDPTRPNGQPRRCVDISRIKHSLRDGLKKTIQWYRANLDALREGRL